MHTHAHLNRHPWLSGSDDTKPVPLGATHSRHIKRWVSPVTTYTHTHTHTHTREGATAKASSADAVVCFRFAAHMQRETARARSLWTREAFFSLDNSLVVEVVNRFIWRIDK